MQQRIELAGDELAVGAELVEHLTGLGAAVQPHRARDPAQIIVAGRQQMGLLIVEELDTVLDATQKDVGLRQPLGRFRLHHADTRQTFQCLERLARADLGELTAANHLQQLHDELDLANAAAR